jgi:hypothetical protein
MMARALNGLLIGWLLLAIAMAAIVVLPLAWSLL